MWHGNSSGGDFDEEDVLGFLVPDLPPGSAIASECLSYGPATLKVAGTIVEKTFPGGPNYESVAEGDKPETVWLLQLANAICVKAGKGPTTKRKRT
jgi:hypothetical protein